MLGRSRRYYSNSGITLVALLLLTSLSPMAFADDDSEDQNYRIVGNLNDFDPATDGKQYLFSTSPVPNAIRAQLSSGSGSPSPIA